MHAVADAALQARLSGQMGLFPRPVRDSATMVAWGPLYGEPLHLR